jgi:hypothetical protein
LATSNSSTKVAKCTQREAAAQQYVPKTGTVTVHAQQYTQQQVVGVYQACLDTRQTLVNLRGQVTAALAAKNQADATMGTFDAGMEAWVATTYGPQSQQAVDFGYAKKAPAKPTVKEKAAAQTKAEATRAARGTKGPKARLLITASPAATPAPTASPVATPAPTAAPSPATAAPVTTAPSAAEPKS